MLRYDETDETPIIDLGKGYTVRLERQDLDEKTQEKAEKELRETPEIKKEAIKEFTLLLSGKIFCLFVHHLCIRSMIVHDRLNEEF